MFLNQEKRSVRVVPLISKAPTGLIVQQYARDIREVIERLGLQEIVLLGWLLGGPVVLSYYEL